MPARRQSAASGDGTAAEGRSRGRDGKEKETFACSFPGCGQSYSRMEYLKRHQRKHQDDRPFACKDCSKAFARSDVLLRHRRRCHPTPPPVDRSSRSPPAMPRGYPGVPVSSSRTDSQDTRERSPYRAGKHPRTVSSSTQDADQPSSSRRRLEDDDEDDDENYAETSRFGRQNGMGNGGVYDMNNYYANSLGDSSTYTPHLLPMFQQAQAAQAQAQGYQGQHDPNHLEDASVLLSMAYGGAGSNENHPTVQGQRVVADDWGSGSTINNMMDSANKNRGTSGSRSGSGSENGLNGQNTVLSDTANLGNFLGAMNWLGGMANKQDGTGTTSSSEGASTNISPMWSGNNNNGATAFDGTSRPVSPFPLSSLFSPSAFGLSSLPDAGDNGNSDETSQAVMSILDQLSKFDTPQSINNMNPERPLLRITHSDMQFKAGPECLDPSSRFYLPAERFAGCYQIPHWSLPPLRTLSTMACRTFNTVLKHFSMVHLPTFRLIDTAACLAFAICTVGGIRSNQEWLRWLHGPDSRMIGDSRASDIDGPLPPGEGWQSMFEKNYGVTPDENDDASKNVGEWNSAHIVRNEKSNMLVKSFSLAKGVLMTEYNVALLQALILYNAPYFLSEADDERALANMGLGTIISIARQIGFFATELEHFEPEYQAPAEPWTRNELDLAWRRWIQLETRRRTAFLIYHLDIVSALESNIPTIINSCEMSNMPLPAPDSLWKATDGEAWYNALKEYKPMTLDEAMRRIFFLPTYGAFDTLHEKADTKYYNLLNTTTLGPFARTALVTTLLRGVMDIGEGKRDRGDWRDLTDLWVSCTWLRPGKTMLDSNGKDIGRVGRDSLRDRFALGLQRWREGWDFDPLCPSAGKSASNSPDKVSATLDMSVSPQNNGSTSPKDSTVHTEGSVYCEEGLPFFWLAQALVNILKNAPPHEPGWNDFAPNATGDRPGVKYGEMLKTARRFTRTGEGICPLTSSELSPCSNTNNQNNTANQNNRNTIGVGSKTSNSTNTVFHGLGMTNANGEEIHSGDSNDKSQQGQQGGNNGSEDILDLEAFEGYPGLEGILAN